jgi:hypothetical protein
VRRREFIFGLIGAVATTPRALFAMGGQLQASRGFVWPASLNDAERAAIAGNVPSVDLDIRFEDGKAEVSQDSLPALDQLGKALAETAANEKGATFLVVVIEEAVDNHDKEDLALRRADAIKQYLVSKYHIDPADLISTSMAGKPKESCCLRVFNITAKPKGG